MWVVVVHVVHVVAARMTCGYDDADMPYHESRDSRLRSGTAEQIIKAAAKSDN